MRTSSTPWCWADPQPPAGLAANVVTTYGLTETGSGVVYDGGPLDGVEVDVDPEHVGDPAAGADAPPRPTGTARPSGR